MTKSSLTLKELKGKKGVGRARLRRHPEDGQAQLRLEDDDQPHDCEHSGNNESDDASLSADEESQEDDKDLIDDE